MVPALRDTKPSELLRSRKALTHTIPNDTELLAAAQLVLPSHPLKALSFWETETDTPHSDKLSQGVMTLCHGQSEERRDMSTGIPQVPISLDARNVEVGSAALVDAGFQGSQ